MPDGGSSSTTQRWRAPRGADASRVAEYQQCAHKFSAWTQTAYVSVPGPSLQSGMHCCNMAARSSRRKEADSATITWPTSESKSMSAAAVREAERPMRRKYTRWPTRISQVQ